MFETQSIAWYAVQVTPKHEQSVATMLEHKGQAHFLPTLLRKHRWSDRTKLVTEPLFPGYLFCHTSRLSIGPILQTSGVLRILSFGGKPQPVADEEINAIMLALKSGRPITPTPYVAIGERVNVVRGPLAGLKGQVTRVKNSTRIIVSVESIMKSISIEIDASEVCIATAPPRTPPPLDRPNYLLA